MGTEPEKEQIYVYLHMNQAPGKTPPSLITVLSCSVVSDSATPLSI